MTMPSTISRTIGGQTQTGEEAKRERSDEGHNDDDEQVGEVDFGHSG